MGQKLNIAFMGIRGIPANYGGFETFVEELAPRLVDKGHRVTVYGRNNNISYDATFYNGVIIKLLPTISHKYLDTIAHTLFTGIKMLFGEKYDVVLIMNAANSPFAIFPKLRGARVAINVDGIERLRKKWGSAGKIYYKLGEKLATLIPDEIVSDADVIQKYYEENYSVSSTMIAYGANMEKMPPGDTLTKLGLKQGKYFLYVTRLEPENNPDQLIRAYKKVDSDYPMVIVGDAPYAKKYIQALKKLAEDDPRIMLPGAIYGTGYRELISNAFCYIQATEVGGTHPALIEAMAVGNSMIVNGTAENREVVADSALIYEKNNTEDLAEKIIFYLNNPQEKKQYALKARERVKEKYSWNSIGDQYEHLFLKMVGKDS